MRIAVQSGNVLIALEKQEEEVKEEEQGGRGVGERRHTGTVVLQCVAV